MTILIFLIFIVILFFQALLIPLGALILIFFAIGMIRDGDIADGLIALSFGIPILLLILWLFA